MNLKKFTLILSIILLLSLVGFFISINVNDDITNYHEYNKNKFYDNNGLFELDFPLTQNTVENMYTDGEYRKGDAYASLILNEDFSEELDYDSLNISAISSNIIINPSSDDTTRIKYNVKRVGNRDKLYLDIYNDNGSLRLFERREDKTKDVFSSNSYGDIILEIPKRLWESVSLSTISGDISSEALDANLFFVKTSSGYIDVNPIAESVELNSTSGDIEFNDLQANSLTIETISGYVTGNSKVDATTSINSSSGDVTLKRSSSENFHINTISGYVELDVDGDDIEVNTSSGDVALKGSYSDVEVNTISGYVNVQAIPDAKIEVQSISGSIITPSISADKKLVTGSESSGQKIEIRTSSGDVNIFY